MYDVKKFLTENEESYTEYVDDLKFKLFPIS